MRSQGYKRALVKGTPYPIPARTRTSQIRPHCPFFDSCAVKTLRRFFLCHRSNHLWFMEAQTGTFYLIRLLLSKD